MTNATSLQSIRAPKLAATFVLLAATCSCVSALADSTSNCGIAPTVPAIPKEAKTYTRSASPDDTVTIQQAIDGLKSGDWLVFAAGTYEISEHLTVLTPGVTLYGPGAKFHSSNPSDGALWIKSDGVAVYGLTLNQDSVARESTPWAGGISVFDDRNGSGRTVNGVTLQNNTINNSSGTGIFVSNVQNFNVINNVVWRSLSDGIHITGGAYGGRVVHNAVSQTGDDMVSVVSYAAGTNPEPAASSYADWPAVQLRLVRNIYIAGNSLADQYWGRGISVVGGSDVTIEENTVTRTPEAAAIYLTRETSYMTFGDHDIMVRDNTLSQIETLAPTYAPPGFQNTVTGHGAIEIGTTIFADEYDNPTWRRAFSISNIALIDNSVSFARFAGIRVGVGYAGSARVDTGKAASLTRTTLTGQVQNLIVEDNKLTNVNSTGPIDPHAGLDSNTIHCSGNTLNGTQWSSCAPGVSGSAATVTVTGASVLCAADGTLRNSSPPGAPTLIEVAPGS